MGKINILIEISLSHEKGKIKILSNKLNLISMFNNLGRDEAADMREGITSSVDKLILWGLSSNGIIESKNPNVKLSGRGFMTSMKLWGRGDTPTRNMANREE